MKFHFPTIEPFPQIRMEDWNSWTWQFKNGLSSKEDFARHFTLSEEESEAFAKPLEFQVRSTPYYVALADRINPRDPVRQMVLPRACEHSTAGQQLWIRSANASIPRVSD